MRGLGGLLCAAGLVLAILGCACAPRPKAVPAEPPTVAEPEPVRVIELIDRREERRAGDRGLVDAAVVALAGQAYPLPAFELLLGGPGPTALVVGEGPREPAAGIVEELEARLGLFGEDWPPAARPPVSVVVGAPDLSEGRYSGLCDLLRKRAPVVTVGLALLDLTGPSEPGPRGWRWEARVVLAGTDPVAVDRVALRILDSARRATAAPPLEELEGPGSRSLAEAEAAFDGQAHLEGIDWIKVPLTR